MNRLFLVFLLCCSLSAVSTRAQDYAPLNAEQLRAIVPSSTRYVSSLSGEWERSIDGNEWSVVKLPMSESYSGKITYRRQIKIDSSLMARYMWHLYFLGLSDVVQLTVNDQYVGSYFGGMVPFMVRIPDKYIHPGTNSLQMVVFPASDDALRSRSLNIFGQRAYNGVLREVLLVGVPQVMMSDIRSSVQLINGDANVTLNTTIATGSLDRTTVGGDSSRQEISLTKASVTVTAELHKPGSEEIVASSSQQMEIARDRTGNLQFTMRVTSPQLWSPADPALYRLQLRITVNGQTIDEYSAQMGLAAIEAGNIANQSLLHLNGNPVFVKAVDYIEEATGGGATITAAEMERDVQLLKTLGVNLVRVRYLAPHPYFVYLCNKYGVMLVIDMPAYDMPASILGSEEVMTRMKNIAERMLNAYERQPCLAAWNICDGMQQDKPETYMYIQKIGGLFHESSSRPVMQAVRFRSKTVVKDNIDIVLFDADRFDLTQEQIAAETVRLSQVAGKPFALSFGKPVQPDNRNGYSDPISIEAQASYVQRCYSALRNAQGGGVFVWSFTDYSLNRSTMLTNTAGDYTMYSGLCDMKRQKRLGFDMYKALLNDEKDPLLQPGTYSIGAPLVYIIGGIILVLVLIVMMNRSRRFREYFLRALIYPYNFYADIRDQRILSRTQTVALAGIIAATTGIFTSTILYSSRMSSVAEYLVMLLFPQEVMKSLVSNIAWSPEIGTAMITLFVVVLMVLFALLLRASAFFVRGRIFFSDTFIITVWSSLPVVLFLPFSIVLLRVLDIMSVTVWVIIGIVLLVWVLYRILRATSVVFDVNPLPVYGIGISVLGGLGLVLLLSYNSAYSIFAYMKYFFAAVM